jgi:hypothetical protein
MLDHRAVQNVFAFLTRVLRIRYRVRQMGEKEVENKRKDNGGRGAKNKERNR